MRDDYGLVSGRGCIENSPSGNESTTKRAIHFRCFEDVASHLFCVQSADFYALPVTVNARREFDRQFVELFIKVEPKKRSRWFATVGEAIAAREEGFSSMGRNIADQEKKDNAVSGIGPKPSVRAAQSGSALPPKSDVNLFCYRERVVDLDAEVSNGALDLGMPQKELYGSQVSGASTDQSRFSPTKGIEADPDAALFYRRMGAKDCGLVPSGSIPGRMIPKLVRDL